MPTFSLPAGAIPAELLQRVRLQIVAASVQPPEGEGWLHEVRHGGHRLLAITVSYGSSQLSQRREKLLGGIGFGEKDRPLDRERFHPVGLVAPARVGDAELGLQLARPLCEFEAIAWW